MKLEKERKQLVEAGRQLLGTGMTVATGGNASICSRTEGLVAITPSGMNYTTLRPEDMCILELDSGKQIEGDRTPSSETPMHLTVFRSRKDAVAVVHTHPPYITAFSIIREAIPLVHYLIPVMGPYLPVADYATYGTEDMGPAAVAKLEIADAVILPNHGLLTVAESLEKAIYKSDISEYIAQSYYLARQMGTPVVLDEEELENLRKQFRMYGQQK